MPKSLLEYADWLDGRNLTWPAPPKPIPTTIPPRVKPLRGIRAVTWSIYGTLLRISDGQLLFRHPQQIRMQIVLEKMNREFNMWNSMYRTPGAPWEYLLRRYEKALEQQELTSSPQIGDFPEVHAGRVWAKIVRELQQKEYNYEEASYGDVEEFGEKLAYFFHTSLQGVEAAPNALAAVMAVAGSGKRQGLLADAQPFTLVQMLRAFREQGKLPPLAGLFPPECSTLSYEEGIRKPSTTLYSRCLERFQRLGVAPDEVLHVGTRIQDDLDAARRAGMKVALYAGDGVSLDAKSEQPTEPEFEPDRVLTDLLQIRDVLSLG